MKFDMLYEQLMNEIYSEPNTFLKKYMLSKSVEFDDIVISYIGANFFEDDNEDILEELAKKMNMDTKTVLKTMMKEPYEVADAISDLPKDMLDRVEEYVDLAIHGGRVYGSDMQSEMPTRYHMHSPEMVKRDTWLVHFTDYPDEIKKNGFIYGIDDPSRLGLTTYYKKEAKKHGGYNFAFVADSRYASYAASDEIYGKHAVMFQNAGVKAWHIGDEEEQVMFWGKDVKPSDIVVMYRGNDDWSVARQDREGIAFKAEGSNDFDKVVKWVMQNFGQYRKIIA